MVANTESRSLTVKIKRYNPESDAPPRWEEFRVDADPMDRVLDVLQNVKWEQDETLGLRRSCAHGVCGSDAMRINGTNGLACKILVKNLKSDTITVEPILGLPVIKDLIVDMKPFFDHYKSVLPFLMNDDPAPTTERLQSPEQRARFDDSTKCILCACCTTACPPFWGDQNYVGPAAIVNAHRFIFDSRDHGAAERLDILNDTEGVWRCRTVFNCTSACPRDIKVTQTIQEVKRAMLTGSIDFEGAAE
ncbi:succinate dehydrogenase iron-sulfur subunit [Singulisphaera acidiphila]|uniref:succinate dehydrogenase n=1 Tax=Singulisphaera acidiphila (strain ATCC BAA-1392 / DSM 18658 / VKM B-2454 / MOB10) TaxID=886293 RepID=L0DN98_SINAD|nr:succinate dehydrogenase iron-sulfur subunit [Singulisphaera acidiphila]AGA30727.1 succinate dehydrogenase and fumarate reductase iron-sulfur protein [Singulisphaera acidiphila DSM 18658]